MDRDQTGDYRNKDGRPNSNGNGEKEWTLGLYETNRELDRVVPRTLRTTTSVMKFS